MKQLVESLKRLYIANRITEAKILDMYNKKVISEEEKNYILN